jgi:biopolymer transport protein ExbB
MSSRQTKQLVFLCAGLALAALAGQVLAQEGAPAAAAAAGTVVTESAAVGRDWTLWTMILMGGWTMIPIGLESVLAIGLIIYGMLMVKPQKMLAVDLLPQLQDELDRLHLDNAKSLCAGTPCLLTNTLHAGLERISSGVLDVSSMEKAMEEASVQEITNGMRPINYLSIIATSAPMWGLLGTVSGMIKAFNKIGLGGMGKPELLASNIGEAMITTAAGLLVAIPTLFAYFFIKGRFVSNVSQMNRLLGNLSHRLVEAARRGDGGQA